MKTTSINQETKKVNVLRYSKTKVYNENGQTFRMVVKISLDDECKNGCCNWSITADIDKKGRYEHWQDYGGGCCHEEILKHFPEFQKIVDLHLCDCYGAPMYAVENGFYIMHHNGKDKGQNYLRVTDEEAEQLYQAPDKAYFKYLLYRLGIVRRWADESLAAIRELEALTGRKWVNPYDFEEERRHVKMFTDEEAKEMNERINSGYYEPEAIEAREEEARKKAIEEKRNKIINRCTSMVKEAEKERDILLYILDSGLSVDNVIYYHHTNKVVFNWKDFGEKISQEDFITFLNGVDYSKLPEGVTFEIKH